MQSTLPLVIFGVAPVIILEVDAGVALLDEMATIKCLNIQIVHKPTCI